MGASLFTEAAYRFRNDDGSETTATWKGLQNVSVNIAVNANFRIRFKAQETAGSSGLNKVWQLQYNKNSAGWVNVTGSSIIARSFASPNVTDAANLTVQLSGGTGTFQGATGFDEANGQAGGNSMDVAASGNAEAEFCLQLRSVDLANADQVGLRISDAGAALNAYAVNAVATVLMSTRGDVAKNLGLITLTANGQLAANPVVGERTGISSLVGAATVSVTAGSTADVTYQWIDGALSAITLSATMFRFRTADLSKTLNAITLASTGKAGLRGAVGTANIDTRYFAAGYFTDTYWWDGEWQISVAGAGLTLLPIRLDAAMGPAPGIGVLIHIPVAPGNHFYFKDTYFAASYFYHYYFTHFAATSNDYFTLSSTATLALKANTDITLAVLNGFDLGMGEQPFGYLPLGFSQSIAQGSLLVAATFIHTLNAITLSATTAATLANSSNLVKTLNPVILISEGQAPTRATLSKTLSLITINATGHIGEAILLPVSFNGHVPIFETNDTANNLVPVHFVATLDNNIVPVHTMNALDDNVVPIIRRPAGPNVVPVCEVE